jgi:hypothetical protein
MVLPPEEAGEVKFTIACPLPAVAVTPVGASGLGTGVVVY